MGAIFSSPEPDPLPPPIEEEAGKTVARREKRRLAANRTETILAGKASSGSPAGLKTILGG